MEPNQESVSEPLKGRPPNQFETGEQPNIESSTPQDPNDILYIVLIGVGIGFALPYHSFFMASDYWQHRFNGYSVTMDITMTYTIITLATVLLNNLFLSLFSFKVRITFGLIVAFITMAGVVVCEIAWHAFGIQFGYSIVSVAGAVTAIGCAIQQSSFYGFASMFPVKYTQAILVGEGLAGFIAAVTRILCNFFHHGNGSLTIGLFLIPTIYIAFSCVLYAKHIHAHSPFVQYYVSASNMVRRPVESQISRRLSTFPNGPNTHWGIARTIYPFMVCIALTYFVTVSLYPGVETEIISCNLKTWMPVLLLFVFHTFDVIGKMVSLIPYPWSKRQLILLTLMRSAILALLLLCTSPRAEPIIAGEVPPFMFTAALGITNGMAASIAMMQSPIKVPATLKEATGNIMTFAYNIGVTTGLLIGFVFDDMRGPPIVNPCPKFPFIPRNFSIFSVLETDTLIPSTSMPNN